MDLLILVALVFAVLGIACFIAGYYAIRKRRLFGTAASGVVGLLFVTLAALCSTIAVATQGYRALTREEVAALIETAPMGSQSFRATFRFPDGAERSYTLAGDEVYVDAHILKWKPIANVLGLHTAYELDRVGGRYVRLEDEQNRPRTVFSLAERKPVDMFELRRRFPLLRPLVDAEYGSATFVLANRPARFEVRVSTTGLLIRRVGGE